MLRPTLCNNRSLKNKKKKYIYIYYNNNNNNNNKLNCTAHSIVLLSLRIFLSQESRVPDEYLVCTMSQMRLEANKKLMEVLKSAT